MTDYDIIVIGAGCGGLTAAAFAVKEHKKVLVLESQNAPGGVMTSFNRGRFEFEAALSSLRGFSENARADLSRLLQELGIENNIQLTQRAECFRIITNLANGESLDMTLPFGTENYIEAINKIVPNAKTTLERIFAIARDIENAESDLVALGDKVSSGSFKKFQNEHADFVSTAAYSVNEVFGALGLSKKAADILNATFLLCAMDCDRLSFVEYVKTLYAFLESASALPKRRSSDVSMALASFIESNGGRIIYNSPVSKLATENGKVTGVILKNGERLSCAHVIASCSPTTVYTKMIKSSAVPQNAFKRVNAAKLGARNACVYLGLNRSAFDLGIKEQTVFVSETADTASQFTLMGDIATNNAFIADCPNVTDVDASPVGTCILRLTTFYTDNCWADIKPEKYYAEKDLLAARLIAKYEDALEINIHNSIEELEVATPVTFARYTNSPKGVTQGYAATDWDGALARFMTEKNDSDIDGLRFCGGWGVQLSGVNSAAATGRNALYATLNDIENSNGGENNGK